MQNLSMLLGCVISLLTAFIVCTMMMVAIQYYFQRRAKQIEAIMRGPFGFVVSNQFIDNAFKKWWIPINKLLKDKIWDSSRIP